jgi:hypothetical protein
LKVIGSIFHVGLPPMVNSRRSFLNKSERIKNDSGIEARWQIKVNVQPVCDVLLIASQRHSLTSKPCERS